MPALSSCVPVSSSRARAAARATSARLICGSSSPTRQHDRVVARRAELLRPVGVPRPRGRCPMPRCGRDLDDLRPVELQVAFDAAGRGLALPPVEDAVETGLAVRDVQRHLVGADPAEHGAERLLDRVAAPARAPRRLERRGRVDLDREHRRIGRRLPCRRAWRATAAPRAWSPAACNRAYASSSLLLATSTPSTSTPGITSPEYTMRSSTARKKSARTRPPSASAPMQQHAPPGGRAGANDRAGVRRDGPHRTGRLPKGSRRSFRRGRGRLTARGRIRG